MNIEELYMKMDSLEKSIKSIADVEAKLVEKMSNIEEAIRLLLVKDVISDTELLLESLKNEKTIEEVQSKESKKIVKSYQYEDKDEMDIAKWIRLAQSGDSYSQNKLGNVYYNGKGRKLNYREAVNWYKKSARAGNADAQNNLANCYYSGKGVSRNYKEAVKWYKKAAERGNVDAQNDLAYCYYSGNGVKQNYEEAVKWYEKAASQGYGNAKEMLEILKKQI